MMILNIRQARFIKQWVMFKGSGNPYILLVSRLVPSIPLGMVSKLYGSMNYDFIYYICLSTLGFAPRIYIYTKIGAALYNPFSREFIILLMIIVAFTGITSLVFNIFYGIKSKQMTQTLLLYSQKEKYKIVLYCYYYEGYHTNEIAQSEAYLGHKWCSYWFHVHHLNDKAVYKRLLHKYGITAHCVL